MERAKASKVRNKRAKIVGDPIIDSNDKRIVYCVDVGGIQGNAWEYKDTGQAAIAVVNFNPEIHTDKRGLIWSAVNEWRAANREKYAGLLGQL
jgi:hypothetical protein